MMHTYMDLRYDGDNFTYPVKVSFKGAPHRNLSIFSFASNALLQEWLSADESLRGFGGFTIVESTQKSACCNVGIINTDNTNFCTSCNWEC